MKTKYMRVLALVGILFGYVLRTASSTNDEEESLRALLRRIMNTKESAMSKTGGNADFMVNKPVSLELSDKDGCYYGDTFYKYGDTIYEDEINKLHCSKEGVVQYDFAKGKDMDGSTSSIQDMLYFNLSVSTMEQKNNNEFRFLRVVPNDTTQQLFLKASKRIGTLIATRINLKLDFKITRRILNKIGNIPTIVPDNIDYDTKETLEIGKAVSLGRSVIEQAAEAGGPKAKIATAVAFFVLDFLKLGLDLGDFGGYKTMGTLGQYIVIKEKLDHHLMEIFKENDAKYPSEIGPLDKLSKDDMNIKLQDQLNIMLNPKNIAPLFAQMWTKLSKLINDGLIQDSDIEDDSKMEMYLNEVDLDEVLRKLATLICIQQGGKIINGEHSDFRCSYKEKLTCESSYKSPLQEGDIYAEFKSTRLDGTCIHAQYALKTICTANHLSYSTETGLCIIDEDYCKMKGADWGYNDRIQEYDCVLNKGQEVAESIFGTTIVRGLKQIFDPKQYKPCNSDEFDDGYFCRLVKCTESEEQNGGFCYPKCKEEFHPVGCCICSPNCPQNWTDDGATCRKAGQCPPGKDHQGALCYDNCKDGFYGVGPICLQNCPNDYVDKGVFCLRSGSVYAKKSRPANKRPCPDGMRDDGLSCWLDTYSRGVGRIPDKTPCADGLRDDGISCWSDAHIYGKGCCCTIFGCCNKCSSGYHDDGCTCRKTDIGIKVTLFQRQSCQNNEEKNGALCYPNCKDGYHPVGCCLCEPDGGPSIKLNLFQRQYCNANETNVAGICWEHCEAGFTDDGAFCRDSFTKKSYGRGVGFPDTQIQGKPNTSYGRGFGKTAVHIRAKERAVPFSTTNN